MPWFGGKRRVAPEVWAVLGDVDNYVEPFAGSLAVLLERPGKHTGPTLGAETVNDADAYLANLWRAIHADPEGVARAADWPVNETDLIARHSWLVTKGRERIARLEADPEWYDSRVAGWWLWGQCAWIGSGWCSGKGPWAPDASGLLARREDTGRGVNRQRPHLGNTGQGVNRQLPHLGSAGEGEEPLIYGYMRALAARLRRVRVCCGDWSRVVTDGALAYGASVGVLLDPPYDTEHRTAALYAVDDEPDQADSALSAQVRDWAIEHGSDPRMRIALCGYEGEHEMPPDWREHAWSSSGAYLGGQGGGVNRANRHRERIWFSPHCLRPSVQGSLFGVPA
jgi:hypothetical protein